MKIKGILFDMDGTLVDSEKYYTEGTYEWMKREGFQGSLSEIYSIVGLTMEQTYDYLNRLLPTLSKEEIRQKNEQFFLTEKPLDFQEALFFDVKETLFFLKKRGYRLALCSLSGRSEVENFLRANKFLSLFDCVLAREDCVHAKPNPEIWLKAIEKLNLQKEEVIIVEDSPNGILSGKRSGMCTWARRDSRFGSDQTLADAFFDDLSKLVEFVEEKNNE